MAQQGNKQAGLGSAMGQAGLPSEIGGALAGLFGGGGQQGGGQQPQLGGGQQSGGGLAGAGMGQAGLPSQVGGALSSLFSGGGDGGGQPRQGGGFGSNQGLIASAPPPRSYDSASPMFSQFSMPQQGGFDGGYYMQSNPGVAAAVRRGQFDSPLQHYRLHGRDEGRSPSPGYNLAANYLSPGLGQQFGDQLQGSGILSALGGWGMGDPSRTAADYRQPYGLSVQAQEQEDKLRELQDQVQQQAGPQGLGPNWDTPLHSMSPAARKRRLK